MTHDATACRLDIFSWVKVCTKGLRKQEIRVKKFIYKYGHKTSDGVGCENTDESFLLSCPKLTKNQR